MKRFLLRIVCGHQSVPFNVDAAHMQGLDPITPKDALI
jgi:hypothetical protein